LTREEAEDVASEAIIRAARQEELDLSDCGAWLHVVTRRLAVDEIRRRPSSKLLSRLARHDRGSEEPHERTLEQAEASWVATIVEQLSDRQEHVLRLKASGYDMAAIAAELQCSYKTVESLVSRARSAVRRAMERALAWLGLALLVPRRGSSAATQSAAPVVAAAFVVLVAVVAPGIAVHGRKSPGAIGSEARRLEPVRLPGGASGPRETPKLPAARLSGPEDHVSRTTGESVLVRPGVVGPVHHGGVRTTKSRDDQSLVDSARTCLHEGLVVTPEYVGCPRP
jgi:RNA polymerase sigma factor (sigma-70 family)